ncbi:MAG TPA: DUF2852 domain-containing protein [Acidiphilium sp.]
MSGTATPNGYGASPWADRPGWGENGQNGGGQNGGRWGGPQPDRGCGGHRFFASRAPWIAVMVLGFIAWWPIGLLALAFLVFGGRHWAYGWHSHWHSCAGHGPRGRWSRHGEEWAGEWKREWKRDWKRRMHRGGWNDEPPPSGNRAFDDYRAETLRRLEEEQKEFSDFLDRLRYARDKAEFDSFMTERRERPPSNDGSNDDSHDGSPENGPSPGPEQPV